MGEAKNERCVAAGRLGGLARARSLTALERSEAARNAVSVRWGDAEDQSLKLAGAFLKEIRRVRRPGWQIHAQRIESIVEWLRS